MIRPRTGRTARLVVYLTPTELAAFERKAGPDRQAWARAALLGDEVEVVEVRAGRPPRPKDAVRWEFDDPSAPPEAVMVWEKGRRMWKLQEGP